MGLVQEHVQKDSKASLQVTASHGSYEACLVSRCTCDPVCVLSYMRACRRTLSQSILPSPPLNLSSTHRPSCHLLSLNFPSTSCSVRSLAPLAGRAADSASCTTVQNAPKCQRQVPFLSWVGLADADAAGHTLPAALSPLKVPPRASGEDLRACA